jgi:hypothetical protein
VRNTKLRLIDRALLPLRRFVFFSTRKLGARLIKTVWIAAVCLATIGGLFATRVTASMYPAEETAADPMATAGLLQDTLTRADKFGAAYTGSATDAVAVLPAKRADLIQTALKKPARHGSLQALHPNAKRIAGVLPKPRPKTRMADNDRSTGAASNCAQLNGPGGIVTWFNDWLHCGS